MVPILLEPSATSFDSNGIGPLVDAISCKVTEELNGPYELEMTYPKTGKYFSEIKYSSIIVAKPFQNGKPQAFRIYKISKPMKGNVQIYARHISYQLNYIPCSVFSGQTCANVLANIKTAVAEYCPFNFSTDVTTNRTEQSKNLLADLDTTGDTDAKAPEYDATKVYNVGDYVKYGKYFYKCLVNTTGDASFNVKHWEKLKVSYVGFINAAINVNSSGGYFLQQDENAVTVWVRCEKSKRYLITKKPSGLFRVGTMTHVPSAGKPVDNVVVKGSADRKLEYTTNSTAEYLVFYLYHKIADGDEAAMNSIVSSAAIRALGTYSWKLNEPKTIRTFLLGQDDNSIQAIYGGEYEWDNYNVILHENRGSDKGVMIKYGKNLIDLTQEENIENTITGIYPIYKSDEGIVQLPEKVVHSSNAGNFPYLRSVIQDFSGDFDNVPTEDELRDMAELYIQNEGIGVPDVSLTVNFVNLSETEEYKNLLALQTVNLGDLVTVDFPDLEVNVKQKVSKTEYDVLTERYTSVTIGNLEKKIDTTLEDQMNALSQKVSEEEAQNKVDRATGVLNAGARGHVIIGRNDEGFANEMYYLDNPNAAIAKNVLRINMNGIGFSSNGILGPYYQAWTLDGHLSLGGVNNSHGTLEILDSNGQVLGKWDKDGIYINTGNIEGVKIIGSEFISKNRAFYVQENGEEVEVGWSGWDVWNRCMKSQYIAWDSNGGENPASGDGAAAAMNGGCQADDESSNGYPGTAGFKALWLDDEWFWGSATGWSYKDRGHDSMHLWDVAETLRWLAEGEIGLKQLNDRVAKLEKGGGGGDECPTEGCGPLGADCPFYQEECTTYGDCNPVDCAEH